MSVPGGGLVQRYQQRVGGLPVLGAETVVAAPSGGAPILVADSTAADVAPQDPAEAISRDSAVAAARAATGAEAAAGPVDGTARRRPGDRQARLAGDAARRPIRSPTTW